MTADQPDILAIDLGTTAGFATRTGKALDCYARAFPGDTDAILGGFLAQVRGLLPTKLLVIEEPFVGHKNAAAILHGMAGIARGLAAAHNIECMCLAPATIKKAVTGHGRASKIQVQAAVQTLAGRQIESEHAADAVAALIAAERRMRFRRHLDTDLPWKGTR